MAGSLLAAALFLLLPAAAHAQYGGTETSDFAIGEKYWIEASAALWKPDVSGQISSEQFGLIGTNIDFVDDLGYAETRFKDFKIVLRPTRKAKFRIQYTPVQYAAETTFTRNIVFNGIAYPLGVPIESSFDWKVWRFGYEYDFIYRSRGYVGVIAEVRYTQMNAQLATNSPAISPRYDEFTSVKAPLPAFGLAGRVYPLPALAVNFEMTGMKLPDPGEDNNANYLDWYKASYYDVDINGTFNVTNNVGVQAGWRKMKTDLEIDLDTGNLQFQGFWFGAVLRY